MGGTLKGSIDHFFSASPNGALYRDQFAALVRFFDSNTQMTRIASQAGNAGGSNPRAGAVDANTIRGWSSDASYSGENAFGVWRWDRVDGLKVYVLVQWHHTDGWAAPGTPAAGALYYQLAVQFALDSSGGNPWNGGAGNLGADSKNGTNVWVPNGGNLCVWPRANGAGGSGATVRQYVCSMVNGTSFGDGPNRIHFLMDDDFFACAMDHNANGSYDALTWFGTYTPHAGFTPDVPLVLINYQSSGASTPAATDIPMNTDLGTLTGVSGAEGGIVVDSSLGVRILRHSTIQYLDTGTTLLNPNGLSGAWDELPLFLRAYDPQGNGTYGLAGKIDASMLAIVGNCPSQATNLTKTKIVVGSGSQSNSKWLLPWDGATTPGSNMARNGIQF